MNYSKNGQHKSGDPLTGIANDYMPSNEGLSSTIRDNYNFSHTFYPDSENDQIDDNVLKGDVGDDFLTGKHGHIGDKSQTSVEDADMPRFAEPVANVTVSVGRDALLACVVENLKGYKVAWVRVDTQTILSIHHNVISQNNRISLTYNDHRSWYLHIKEVEESDRGWYMCQVNTDPMRSRKGYLQVVVPPMIIEGMTSNDLVVREGLNVTLMCKARGYPEPYVMWRREDGEEMLIGGEQVNVVDGELLHITKVSRLHMAAYLCVASNGVPPSISKRVHLRVQFPPMLSIPNQLEGAYLGQDVILECHTEAYPASINYWTTERGDMIISDTSRAGDKYETTSTVNGYTKYMKLKIRNVGPNDFGTYRCVAKNSLGETDGNIKLDEMPAPTTAILSEMAMLNRSLGTMFSRKNGKRRNKNKLDSNSLPDYGVEEWRDGAGNAGDNNQAPMRNPPDAFHNSAGALAQHNLVGIIIQAIKMQSFGIFKRLTNYIKTINEQGTTEIAKATRKVAAMETLQATATTIFSSTAMTAVIRKTIPKYVYKIQKTILWQRVRHIVSGAIENQIKSTVFIKNQKKQQNHIIENEFKTFKHSNTRETHVSNEKHCVRYEIKLNNIQFSDDKITEMKQYFIDFMKLYTKNFKQRINEKEIFYKINKTLETNINLVFRKNSSKHRKFPLNKNILSSCCISLLIIFYITLLTFSRTRLLLKSPAFILRYLDFSTIITTFLSNHLIFLHYSLLTISHFIQLHANMILRHIVNIFSSMGNGNNATTTYLCSSISLYLNLAYSLASTLLSSSSSLLLSFPSSSSSSPSSSSSSSLCLTLFFSR